MEILCHATDIFIGLGLEPRCFSRNSHIINTSRKIYLVPISGDAVNNSGKTIKEGSFAFMEDEPSLGSGIPILFIALINWSCEIRLLFLHVIISWY
jgi:hypothetical protein